MSRAIGTAIFQMSRLIGVERALLRMPHEPPRRGLRGPGARFTPRARALSESLVRGIVETLTGETPRIDFEVVDPLRHHVVLDVRWFDVTS